MDCPLRHAHQRQRGSHRGSQHVVPVISLAALVVVVTSIPAAAQPLGTVRWQLQPYCNVLTLAITQNGTVFTLDGVDDLCGAGPASALGTAFFNPDGTVGMGLHLVAAPGAAPIHITVALNSATLSGSWTDSAGNGGVLQFNPPTSVAGVPRPPGGGLAGVAVTNVIAGAGLTGGGMGPVNLAVAFAGPGAAATAARSDHTHAKGDGGTAVGQGALAAVTTGTNNTAVGDGAAFVTTAGANNTALGHLALFTNQVGGRNTAVGAQALRVATGNDNTAVGYQSLTAATSGDLNAAFANRALFSNTTGTLNTAIGAQSLVSNTTGWKQTALGSFALYSATTSTENTALGYQALAQVTTGDHNIGIGASAGLSIKGGSHNILIGNVGGPPEENWTIRIGTDSSQLRTFIAGVRGVTTAGAAIPVMVDTAGQLGPSRRAAGSRRTSRIWATPGSNYSSCGQCSSAISRRTRPDHCSTG